MYVFVEAKRLLGSRQSSTDASSAKHHTVLGGPLLWAVTISGH